MPSSFTSFRWFIFCFAPCACSKSCLRRKSSSC
uniref:Uncharacterized protein n=1 Tax=Anguilla anguilla TaxID=7936 RepID=A0A0E9Q4U9_ANGAN